ncbi:AHH domain-containing protein [Archangium primigenium]|uniref:AHH domain-containing protein n=1 Tax=[Archangium] primigenium TaxID=2792470 RepID=UPI001958B6E8|nr:AHH domain-containing protein [Archangium primigenium]MBM7118623.1 AHH domain-containing protein [Archangium primigenium]
MTGARLRLSGGWFLLVLFLQAACATGGMRVSHRHDSAPRESVTLTPNGDFAPVQVSDAEFREAFTQLLLEVPLRVAPRPPQPRSGRLVRASWPPRGAGDSSVEGGYARLCERRGAPGDCFWLLRDGPHDTTLSHPDRFALALGLALAPAVDAATGVLRDASEHALTMLLTGLSLYLVVLMAPEPISKGLATAMTLWLWGYLGSELWDLLSATQGLWDEAEAARTFLELRDASERYAKVLGPNTLRVLILLATWKAGAKGKEAMTGSTLPGFPQAVQNAARAGHVVLPVAASDATSVSVAGGGLTLTLPASSSAVLSMLEEGDIHHIATVENGKSPARGGPWTPKLQELFDKAGMSMEEPANKVRIRGHKGPHPREYHERVFRQLRDAVRRCKTPAQCREALTHELKNLADELAEAGSELNRLVTRNQ